MAQSTENGITTVDADLTNAYSGIANSVQGWTRQLIFNAHDRTLRVLDACQVAAGVSAVFQLHVPSQPVTRSDGTIQAGELTVRPGNGMTVAFVNMTTVDADLLSGWRIDIKNPNGCRYDATLKAPGSKAGRSDFDGDGRSDILWRNRSTGANVIWRSGSSATQQRVTGVTNLAWTVVGSGDYNGDGRADILWRNGSTGVNVIWLSGSSATQQGVTSVTNLAWNVVASGDYDGDGREEFAGATAARAQRDLAFGVLGDSAGNDLGAEPGAEGRGLS